MSNAVRSLNRNNARWRRKLSKHTPHQEARLRRFRPWAWFLGVDAKWYPLGKGKTITRSCPREGEVRNFKHKGAKLKESPNFSALVEKLPRAEFLHLIEDITPILEGPNVSDRR